MSDDHLSRSDEDPQASEGSPSGESGDPLEPPSDHEKKPTSAKQVAANRRNAERSTGPQTPEGKARSSANAIKHGAYASALHPLGSGPYWEAPDEFYERAAKLIAAFEPEDELIAELAKRAADALMKMTRLDAFEADKSLLSGIPDEAIKHHCGDLQAADFHELDMLALKEIAAADMPGMEPDRDFLAELDWQDVAHQVRDLLTTECSIPGLWDDDRKPDTDAEWERAARAILDAVLPDPQDRWVWANGLHAAAYVTRSMIEHKTKAAIATRLINGPLADLERPRNHLWREFNQAVAQIRQIRKMRDAG
jgi:hypothetical protein